MEEQTASPIAQPAGPSASKLKSLIRPMSWLRKNKGAASFSVYESGAAGEEVTSAEELSSTSRQLSDDESGRLRSRCSAELPAPLTARREMARPASASGRSRKARRKYDPRRYVVRRSTTQEPSMGCPPRGYLWLWLGHFKRWHRRFFVLATPGALTYGKRPDMEGGKWNMSLGSAVVSVGKGNSRQFCLKIDHRVVYLRTLSREDRDLWVAYLERSIDKYGEMVERTKQFAVKGLPRMSEEPYSLEAEVDPQMQKMQRDLWVHVQGKMWVLQPHREALEAHLGAIANGMSQALRALGQQDPSISNEQQACTQQECGLDAEQSNNQGSTTNSTKNEIRTSTDQTRKGRQCSNATSVWGAYNNLVSAVEQVIKDEGVRVLELQAENSALRKLLRDRHADPRALGRSSSSFKDAQSGSHAKDEQRNTSLDVEVDDNTSLSSSRSYSTAGSQFVPDGGNNEFLGFKGADITEEIAMGSPSRTVLDDDLIAALEVVRQVEYVTKGHVMSEFDGEAEEPPTDGLEGEDDMEDGGHEDSDTSSPTAIAARTRLPSPKPLRRGFSIWSVLKNAIGRDLTRITLPATINEPLSALQRGAEEFEYYQILEKAAACADPQERLVYITAFVLSSYNSGLLRDNKPFNPLLGETYEWQDENLLFIAEQVSHHPPVSCFCAKGSNMASGKPQFIINGEFELRSKFWGKTLSVFPTGRCELYLPEFNEKYVWNKSYISIHNIIIGTLWLDFHGEILIRNLSSGASANINIPKCGWSLDKRGKVEGSVQDSSGKVSHQIVGNYRKTIVAKNIQSGIEADDLEVFCCNPPPEDMEEQYNMTTFAIGLNDFQRTQPGALPRTDARFRPDVRALDDGEFDVATSEKLRLEEKQRQARRTRKDTGTKYSPKWFKLRNENDKDLVKVIGQPGPSAWEFNDVYWAKNPEDWINCPNIY